MAKENSKKQREIGGSIGKRIVKIAELDDGPLPRENEKGVGPTK